MRTMIIPDLHTRHEEAERMIEHESPDKVVFLGDYFDGYCVGTNKGLTTVEWLIQSMKDKNRTHLLGNHELSYMHPEYRCSGFTEKNLEEVKESGIDLESLPLYAWVDDWLCTHAGLSNSFLRHYSKKEPGEFLKNLSEIHDPRLFQSSAVRGGRAKYAGIIWCDYSEFEPIPDVKQIFGHTKSDTVRMSKDCICLDTELSHYAMCEDGRMRICQCVECV